MKGKTTDNPEFDRFQRLVKAIVAVPKLEAHNPKAEDPKKDPKITNKYRNPADLLQRSWGIGKLRSRQWVVA